MPRLGASRGRAHKTPYRTAPPPRHSHVTAHGQAVAPGQWPPTSAGAQAPRGHGNTEPPPGTSGNLTEGGAWAWAFEPAPAAAGGVNREAEGGQRNCTVPARQPGPAHPPQPAERRRPTRGRRPCTPPPGPGEPPPPGGPRRAGPSAAEPKRRARPDRHLPAPSPQWPQRAAAPASPLACRPATRRGTRAPHGAPLGQGPDESTRTRT